ncbi:ABC transporter ATP-binding protein [Alicyclobacillus acidiphilus]|uniref:ABC transporter ATP-binding protein n=1 Tax=Alicyclobacillus acidiphilus TaxID=182455 RepID=UPI00082AC9D0|nr:ABC transporter ATP-binding protein [Alicyclobacillus acidiphilus]
MAELTLRKVGKGFGDKTVIQELDLHVASGEMVCLIGPSGSGKTTTLRMIGGFVFPDSGHIWIDHVDVTKLTPDKRPTAMVFQQYALWTNMTVYQNVAAALKLRKVPRQEIQRRVYAALDLVDLRQQEKAYPVQLSWGQQQRVALARALVLTPKVLLLDEPLSNLDAQLRHKVRDKIREIQQESRITTVFVTHDQDEALSVSDRVAVMSEGRIEQFDTPDHLYRHPKTLFVANFIGSMNVFRASATMRSIRGALRHMPILGNSELADLDLAVRPEDVILHPPSSQWASAAVTRRILRGHYAEWHLAVDGLDITVFVPNGYPISDTVGFSFRRVLAYRRGVLVDEYLHPPIESHVREGGL